MSKITKYQYDKIKSFRTNLIQKDTLSKLKYKYKIDISKFIRDAIKEKIKKDYLMLVGNMKIKDCPF